MKKIVIRCENPKGGLSYFYADYNGSQLSNFVSMSTNKPLFQSTIKVAFCPDREYLQAEFTGCEITALQVLFKRSELQRQVNMLAIASLIKANFKQ